MGDEFIDGRLQLCDQTVDLVDGMVNGVDGDPDHKCTGRSASARLERVIELADEAGLEIPKIREIYSKRRK